jgi:hypothetical protein
VFTKKTPVEKPPLEVAINDVLAQMLPLEADSDTFAKMNEQLEKLCTMKALDKGDRASVDAILAVVGNLAGILMILSYERVHIVTSKALSFVLKSKV